MTGSISRLRLIRLAAFEIQKAHCRMRPGWERLAGSNMLNNSEANWPAPGVRALAFFWGEERRQGRTMLGQQLSTS